VSRNELGSTHEGEETQPLILPQLGSKQAVQFFLDVLGENKRSSIQPSEIVELILECAFYPVGKVFRDKNLHAIPQVVTAQFKLDFSKMVETFLTGKEYNKRLVEILSHHDLFRRLQGNPTSLSRAANVYLNHFTNMTTLLDLYKMVKENNHSPEI